MAVPAYMTTSTHGLFMFRIKGQKVLIIGFDLLFFSRSQADRFKGAIGRKIDLNPAQIFLNTAHTHMGPKLGIWNYVPPADARYLQWLEGATVDVACQARDAMVEVTLWAGATKTAIPMNRRLKMPNGKVKWAPNPDGAICDALPLCMLKDKAGKCVCLLFSVSCHPTTRTGFEISADFPGVAMNRLDDYLGSGSSLFLQGCAGDTKPVTIGKGRKTWNTGKATWADVEKGGNMVADEAIAALKAGLTAVEPALCTHILDTNWPMVPDIGRAGFEAILTNPKSNQTRRLWAEEKLYILKVWAEEKLYILKGGYSLPTHVPVTAHGIQLGKGLRLISLEGEAVAELGTLILDFYEDGITFPLGYTDGCQLYLHTSKMIPEGGYEVDSFWQYRQPARLAEGMEKIVTDALCRLRENGIT